MKRVPMYIAGFLLIGAAASLAACDAVSPGSEPILVVEAFLETDRPLAPIRLRQTLSMNQPYLDVHAAATHADVVVETQEGPVPYEPVPDEPGLYRPMVDVTLPAGASFEVEISWRGETARSGGRLPERIRLSGIETEIPDHPVEAVLLDSLQLDSLQTGARSAFVYPITVRMWWDRASSALGPDSLNWVRTQLHPYTTPVPGVIELFFRSDQILREDRVQSDGDRRVWRGVYLVPVDRAEDPLPPHSLKVALLRSDGDYARFASSRTAPERREPVGNVLGAIGMVAGISVDSLTIAIP